MLGTGLGFRRVRGEDRFYNPAKARRSYQKQQTDQLRRAQSDYTVSQSNVTWESEKGLGSTDPPKPVLVPVSEPVVSPLSNLERFLDSVIPSVPALYLSKRTMRGWRTYDGEFQPYFVLGDLWESFKEWSAYGAGVPLILNDCDSVVQYYVPYLSGIQIYVDSVKLSAKSRQPIQDSDGDFRDSSSDGSSDCEPERGSNVLRETRNHYMASEMSLRMDRLSMGDQQILQEDLSSDEGELVNSSCLIFEYFERDPPYSREPLADKIADLAFQFPELKTLKSCDLLSSSWIFVSWYPIYRIPTGPTLKDLDACFLTYHCLHTPIGGGESAQAPFITCPNDMDDVPKMSLPVFGLASYKFKGSLWTPNGTTDCHLANSLFQAADNWLRLLHVNQPDFTFFYRR
ncbi:hypothetical protein E1A91_D01G143100v1 [Gossypium mustelinum]|uniref:DUF789 domain-containing protein n=5 Tax=Gossypium TaxID=3633 RepID=A0A5D2W917_GOSMU|nr:hypothetical protein E1A91_D01G143100v1 [Gossypium mustelinum]